MNKQPKHNEIFTHPLYSHLSFIYGGNWQNENHFVKY
jgi:hypothetical protein